MRIFLTLLWVLAALAAQAQITLTPARIFASGVNLRAEFIPAASLNDSARFSSVRYNVQGIVPIRGGAGIKLHNFNLRKIDIEFNQMFLAFNLGYRVPEFSFEKDPQPLYTVAAAITGIHASLRDKIWLYGVGIGGTETADNLTVKRVKPYGMGGAERVKIAGLRTQWFYGGAVLFEPGRITPVPIVGVNTRITKNSQLMVAFPFLATYSHKVGKKTWAEVGLATGGFNAGYQLPEFSAATARLAYRQGKGSFSLNYNPVKPIQLSAEVGVTAFRNMKVMQAGEVLQKWPVGTSPFLALSCYVNFSRSLLDKRGFGSIL